MGRAVRGYELTGDLVNALHSAMSYRKMHAKGFHPDTDLGASMEIKKNTFMSILNSYLDGTFEGEVPPIWTAEKAVSLRNAADADWSDEERLSIVLDELCRVSGYSASQELKT
jgi:hypothetical protein